MCSHFSVLLDEQYETCYTFITTHLNRNRILMLDIKTLLADLDTRIHQFHDHSAKWLLENTENLKALLAIIASDLVEHLDFSRVEIQNTTFIPDDLRQQESDLVYLLPFRDEDSRGSPQTVMVYILVEHQSTVDPLMGLRLLSYMCQIWNTQRRAYMQSETPPSDWRFQPIIPVIFYTGEQHWVSPPTLKTVMDLPEALRRFVPTFDVLLLDVKGATDETLMSSDHPFGWLLTVLKAERYEPEDFVSVLERLRDHVRGLPDTAEGAVWQQVIYYLYLFIFHRRSADEQPVLADIVSEMHPYLGLSNKEEQLMRSMAEVTFQQGKQEGIEQGEKRGTIESILALLNMRFETDAVDALRPALETIDDLRVLREVLLEVPASENLEAFRRTLSR